MSAPSPALFLLLLLAMATGLSGAATAALGGRGPRVGGYRKIKDLQDPYVKEIAGYAVAEHNRLTGQNLALDHIVSGREQVVAGMNYDLVIEVRNGRAGRAQYEAVVYDRAWEHYRNLTSFVPKP